MILSCTELVPAPGNRQAILEILQFVERGLLIAPGCTGCEIYEKLDESHAILYVEHWESEESFKTHLRSTAYLPVLNAMDLAQRAPTINFHEVTATRSMELVEALRSRDHKI